MKEDRMLCSGIECEPPYGGKEDCEFYEDGYCIGAIRPDVKVEKQIRDTLNNFGVKLISYKNQQK